MKNLNGLDITALVLTLIGGLNWGLVGFFKYDLVASIFGGADNIVARIIYSLVGLAAIYLLVMIGQYGRKSTEA